MLLDDPYFKLLVLDKTNKPNLLCYLAMHQCVAEKPIEPESWCSFEEKDFGLRIVNHCLRKGHHSILEHPSISFLVQNYPHEVMVQMTRHRMLSFSVQSQRYTGKYLVSLGKKILNNDFNDSELHKYFYIRPIGEYKDRTGTYYKQTLESIEYQSKIIRESLLFYTKMVLSNMPLEQARNFLPQGLRQDFIVTMNPRSLLHFLDLRTPSDAQIEIRDLAFKIFEIFKDWMPEVSDWYEKNRLGKNKLSP